MKNISAIIVLYGKNNYDYQSLLSHQCLSIIIVDNTPDQDLMIGGKNIYYIPLKNNYGIAKAQNVGVKKAYELGSDYLIFFDQDSIISTHFIDQMLAEYERISSIDSRLFMLGPTLINGRTNENYSPIISKKIFDDYSVEDEIASSGSIVESRKMKKVGYYDESLFIDYVDNEICWRSKSLGYFCAITKRVKLNHFIGNKEWKLGKINIIISAPIRYYYQTRNYMWLLSRDYTPKHWIISSGLKKIVFPLFFPFLTKNWIQIYKNIIRGFFKGLKK